MTRVLVSMFVLVVACTLVVDSAYAQGKGKGRKGGGAQASVEERFAKIAGKDKDSFDLAAWQTAVEKRMDKEKAAAAFAKMDANSDGKVTLDEFKNAAKARAEQAKKGGGKRGGPGKK